MTENIKLFAERYSFLWTLTKEALAVLMIPSLAAMLWVYSNVQANTEFRKAGDRYTLEQAEKDRSANRDYARSQAAAVRNEVFGKLDRIEKQQIETIRQIERLTVLVERDN